MSDKQELAQASTAWNMKPANLGEAMKYAEMIANSGMVPEHYKGNANAVLVACETGSHLGFSSLESCQSIAVINNMPTIWGDALPALAMRHPKFEYIDESFSENTMTATCKIKRQGMPEQVRTFSWTDAERAGLTTKDTYKKYPQRMLKARARAWAVRDVFPDALRGTRVREEVQDQVYTERFTGEKEIEAVEESNKSGMGGLDAALDRVAANEQDIEDAEIVDNGDNGDNNEVETITEEEAILMDWQAKMVDCDNYTELEKIGLELNAMEEGPVKEQLRDYYKQCCAAVREVEND